MNRMILNHDISKGKKEKVLHIGCILLGVLGEIMLLMCVCDGMQ